MELAGAREFGAFAMPTDEGVQVGWSDPNGIEDSKVRQVSAQSFAADTRSKETRSRYVTPKLRGQRRRQPRTSIALCPTMPMTRRSSLPTLPSRKARTRSRNSGQASWGLRVLDLVGNHHCGRGEERAEPRGRWRVGAPRRARRSLANSASRAHGCYKCIIKRYPAA